MNDELPIPCAHCLKPKVAHTPQGYFCRRGSYCYTPHRDIAFAVEVVKEMDALSAALAGPRQGTIWRHYKGRDYRVLGCAAREGDGETLVIYQRKDGVGHLWSRPLKEWGENVGPRFSLVKDKEAPE